MKRITVSPRNFDLRAEAYKQLQADDEACTASIKAFKEAFLRFLRKRGVKPDDAPKSRKYEGSLYEALYYVGQSTKLIPEKVAKFKAALEKAKLGHLFPLIFKEETTYSQQPKASQVIKTLPTKKLLAAYARSMDSKPKPASLKVERKEQPATKAEAAKEAAC